MTAASVDPVGQKFVSEFGTVEILGFRRGDLGAHYRLESWTPAGPDGGTPAGERTRCTGPTDASPRHRTATGYDGRCPCCYLNICHTADLHAANLAPAGGPKAPTPAYDVTLAALERHVRA